MMSASRRNHPELSGGTLSPTSGSLPSRSWDPGGAHTGREEQLTMHARLSPRVKASTPGSVGNQRNRPAENAGTRCRRASASRYSWSMDSPDSSWRSTE